MTKRLREIHDELMEMAEKESMNLFRLARRAKAKGVSAKTVTEIRNEALELEYNYQAYPERLLDWKTKSKLKYAFYADRIKHTYLTVNGDGDVVNVEVR